MTTLNPAWINSIQHATSLENLRDALMGAWLSRPEGMEVEEFKEQISYPELLPAFGGEWPGEHAWGCDAERVLVGETVPGLRIVERE